jgi:phosphonate transport system substrate-binding protein
VANKLVHVASNNNESLARLKVTAPARAEQIRVIWTSPLIASDPLVWRKDLEPALKAKISEFIFTYGTKEAAEKAVLTGLKWAPFRKSDNRQLLPIRQMEVSRSLTRVKSDTTLEAAKRDAEVARLQKEFDELGRQIAALSN